MIVSISDIRGNTKNSAIAAALIGGVSSIGKSKKTLICQFTEAGDTSAFDLLVGKSVRENEIQSQRSFQDDGLDGLAIRAETAVLSKEHFQETVTPLLGKENMLDILKPSKNEKLGEVVGKEAFLRILKGAKDIYECIYVITPSKEQNEVMYNLVTSMTDEDLIIIPQGPAKEVNLTNKTSLVVNNYEPNSKFDLKSMRKAYKVKKIYTIPYNVACRDARVSEDLLDYVIKNRKDIKSDDNFALYSSICALVEKHISGKAEAEEEIVLADNPKPVNMRSNNLSALHNEDVQEVTVKKGLFGKTETKYMVDI